MKHPKVPRRSIRVTDPYEQRKAARYAAAYGARRPEVLVGSILVTPKRARKLLKRARRELAQAVLNPPSSTTCCTTAT
jgi:hypothetical protein